MSSHARPLPFSRLVFLARSRVARLRLPRGEGPRPKPRVVQSGGRANLAARAGRWSAAHWKTASLLWVAFVLVAVVVGRAVGTHSLTDAEQTTGESARAQEMLAGAGFATPAGETVLVHSKALTVGAPAFQKTVREVMGTLRTMPQVKDVRTGGAGEISRDRHSQLIQFDMRGKLATAHEHVQPVEDVVATAQELHPGFTVAEFGVASAQHELDKTLGKDFQRAERLTLPVTFLILLIAFGSFVAAGVPVLLAFSAVLASIGLAQALSPLAHMGDATKSVALLMGMAVGVDYSLFYLKRIREESLAGHDFRESLHRAAATSGQAVLVSGCTVLIAMAGMLFAGGAMSVSIAIGAMLVVFTSLIGSLTVLPAVVGKLGSRVDRGIRQVLAATALRALRLAKTQPAWLVRLRERPTLLVRAKGERQESRAWAFVLGKSMRYPLAAALLATAFLVVLSLPVFSMHTKMPGFADLPKSLTIGRTYTAIQKAFPGSPEPAHLVVEAKTLRLPVYERAYAEFRRRALATGVIHEPIRMVMNPTHNVARIDFPLAGNGEDAAANHALEVLRKQVIAPVLATLPPDTRAAVTGDTAGTHDFNATTKQRAPIVFAFVLGLAFLLLLLTFRSIVVPIKAILLNLLSVGAAYGVLVWIFQDGHLQGVLDFRSNGGITTWLPLFLFTVLFGLSMDYHVFILSRVKELVDRGVPTDEAVARGIRATASTVTAAATVMVAVFAVFASLRTLDMKQTGLGLAVAVFLDATVIRGVLLPAAMKLLGDWNWYLPRWLEWLPRLNAEAEVHEHEPVPEPGAAVLGA